MCRLICWKVELNRQTSNMGQAMSNVSSTVSALNDFTSSMIQASISSEEREVKMEKLYVNLSTFPIILAASISGGAALSAATQRLH